MIEKNTDNRVQTVLTIEATIKGVQHVKVKQY